ncbi:MAG: hypothetical protein ACRDV8_08130, partial [Acidimicrobiales bacterium]
MASPAPGIGSRASQTTPSRSMTQAEPSPARGSPDVGGRDAGVEGRVAAGTDADPIRGARLGHLPASRTSASRRSACGIVGAARRGGAPYAEGKT